MGAKEILIDAKYCIEYEIEQDYEKCEKNKKQECLKRITPNGTNFAPQDQMCAFIQTLCIAYINSLARK